MDWIVKTFIHQWCSDVRIIQCESKKIPQAVFWHFPQTVGNF